jgi:hypothetical protein
MKALPFSHLTDTQYLMQFLRIHNISVKVYHDYCLSMLDVHQCVVSEILHEHSINVIPYLFTSSIVDTNSFDRFLMYCSRYIQLPIKEVKNDVYMLNILQKDIETMIIILLLMQYYFL